MQLATGIENPRLGREKTSSPTELGVHWADKCEGRHHQSRGTLARTEERLPGHASPAMAGNTALSAQVPERSKRRCELLALGCVLVGADANPLHPCLENAEFVASSAGLESRSRGVECRSRNNRCIFFWCATAATCVHLVLSIKESSLCIPTRTDRSARAASRTGPKRKSLGRSALFSGAWLHFEPNVSG